MEHDDVLVVNTRLSSLLREVSENMIARVLISGHLLDSADGCKVFQKATYVIKTMHSPVSSEYTKLCRGVVKFW